MSDPSCDTPYVRGTVIAETTEARVAHATVWLVAHAGGRYLRARRTKTDAQGHFSLPGSVGRAHANRPGAGVRGFRLEVEVAGRRVRVITGTSEWATGETPEEVTLSVRLRTNDTAQDDPVGTPSGEGPTVRGRVRHLDGTPAEGALVRAYQVTMTTDVELGNDAVSSDGDYAIAYAAPNGTTRLLLRVFSDAESEESLAASDVRFAPAAHERIDLTLCDEAFRAATAWSRLDAAIPAALGSMPAAEATGRAAALVTAELDESGRRVARYLCARRLAPRLGVEPQAIFGLLYSGTRPTVTSLSRLTAEQVQRALSEAADANEIDRAVADAAPGIADDVGEALASLLGDPQRAGGLGPLLSVAGVSDAQRSAIATLGLSGQGDAAAFWGRLREHSLFNDDLVDDIRSVVVLGSITFRHAPLVQALRVRLGTANAEGAAALEASDWAELLEEVIAGAAVGLPGHAHVVGETPAERTANYIKHLMVRTETVFPSRVVVERLKSLHVGSDLGTLLTAVPELDFARVRVPYDLTQAGHTISDTVKEQLRTYQRLFRIAPSINRYAAMSALKDAGIVSALPIARMGSQGFVARFADSLGSQARARLVYTNAVRHAAAALVILGNLHPATQAPASLSNYLPGTN